MQSAAYVNADFAVFVSAAEHQRLLDQHKALVSIVKGRILHAPITSPRAILDVGCGTGVITRFFASRYPSAHVTGVDLCPVPAEAADTAQPNLAFINGNFRELVGRDRRLQYGTIDLAYSRLLWCGMTDWPGYVREMFAMLRPGGWAEFGDYVEDVFYDDDRRGCPRRDWEWLRALRTAGSRKGLDLDCGTNITRYMQDAGFVDIRRWEYQVPIWRDDSRPETKQMAEHMIDDRWGLYWHMLPKMLEDMNYSEKKIDKLRREMRHDMREERGKYQVFSVTVGRKPT